MNFYTASAEQDAETKVGHASYCTQNGALANDLNRGYAVLSPPLRARRAVLNASTT